MHANTFDRYESGEALIHRDPRVKGGGDGSLYHF
jgi:hypothetical protein